MEPIITVNNLSKKYELGLVGSGTLYNTLAGYLERIKGVKIKPQSSKDFWALSDIEFNVNEGDIIGIIGRNGAGKSTLLKVLSRITDPTCGIIKIKGRIASLLEVGTGFHPELTGRENIFLNGSLLGMSKAEIKSKFDEIVDFSGVEKFLDTPVKRYSSGMYVRLAFAVAAHLEPEILVIDEVLSVGDAEFQKKCIGKMSEASKTGRTVLFVSHNMAAVKSLCNRGILLNQGKLIFQSNDIDEVVSKYLNSNGSKSVQISKEIKDVCFIDKIEVNNGTNVNKSNILMSDSVLISISLEDVITNGRLDVTLQIKDDFGNIIFPTTTIFIKDHQRQIGKKLMFNCEIPGDFFNQGDFYVNFLLLKDFKVVFSESDICTFTISPITISGGARIVKSEGALFPKFINWNFQRNNL